MNDRPRRSASQVKDYRQYHLSGDLQSKLQGKVASVVAKIQTPVKGAHKREEAAITEEPTGGQSTDLHTLIEAAGVIGEQTQQGRQSSAITPGSNTQQQTSEQSTISVNTLPSGITKTDTHAQTQHSAARSLNQNSRMEQLKLELEASKEESERLKNELDEMKIRAELERQEQQRKEWEMMIQVMKQAREETSMAHEKRLEEIRDNVACEENAKDRSSADWLHHKMEELKVNDTTDEHDQEVIGKLCELLAVKDKLMIQQGECIKNIKHRSPEITELLQALGADEEPRQTNTQTDLMQQLRAALQQ